VKTETIPPGFHDRLAVLIGKEEPFVWAKRVGIPSSTFSRIWHDRSIPKWEHIFRISEFAGCTIDWLMTGKDPVHPLEATLDEIEASLHQRAPTPDELAQGAPEWEPTRRKLLDIAFNEEAPGRLRARADLYLDLAFQDPEASRRREANAGPALKRFFELDEELNARVVDGISRLYKDEGAGLSPMDLGRLAARVYADLVNGIDDPRERLIGLKVALEQLRRELRKPADDTSSKRLA
jgi:transcriptional regulator with XRE-family HTH domain